MHATSLDWAAVEQLRYAHAARKPGTLAAAIGYPAAILLPMAAFVASLFIVGAVDNGKDAGHGARQPSDLLGATCVIGLVAVPVCWGLGALAVMLAKRALNARFRKRNTVEVEYSLTPQRARLYRDLVRAFDALGSTEMFEIVWEEHAYHHGDEVYLGLARPPYLRCNVDVYCLETADELFYFLPDCILLYCGPDIYLIRWPKFNVSVNNVSGVFNSTAYRLTWAYARVDGGPDRRYKYNWQVKVPYSVQRAISEYGVISLRVGGIACVVLSPNWAAVGALQVALAPWQQWA
jgi:hypothetical protein